MLQTQAAYAFYIPRPALLATLELNYPGCSAGKIKMVGAPGFEPGTSRTPFWRANQATLRPDLSAWRYRHRLKRVNLRRPVVKLPVPRAFLRPER